MVNNKINKLKGENEKKQVELKSVNKQQESEMFSTIRTALDVDSECKKYTGLTRQQIISELMNLKAECKRQAGNRINSFFMDAAMNDIDLLFNTVMTSLCSFTMMEAFNVYQKILKRIEKILSENDKFYKMSAAEKNEIFMEQIIKFIPDWQMPFYNDLLMKEKENAFSLYNDFIQKIQAQDFILRGSFINIQYDNNGNFMIINFPDFLIEINKLFIEHMILSFTYGHNLKFGASVAIVDMEDQGFRFNLIHKSLDVYGETSVFIRKNISKPVGNAVSKIDFDFANYYYNLFSELPEDAELAEKIIWKSNSAKKRLEFKFDGFKAKNYVDEPYGLRWYMAHVMGLSPVDMNTLEAACNDALNVAGATNKSDIIAQFRDELYGTSDMKPYDQTDVENMLKSLKGSEFEKVVYSAIGDRISGSAEVDKVVSVVKGRMLSIMCDKVKSMVSESGITPIDVAKYGMIDVMKRTVQDKNAIVVGPTGSGKSTLLSKILSEKQMVNPEQNLLTIEDTAELNIPNAISYITNSKYKIHDVFVATLRQNPSRVIIGETRGPEIIDILETCLTSKSGTTIHSTSFTKMEMRLKLMVGKEMNTEDLFYLTSSAVDIFIFIVARKITGIYVRNSKHYNGNLEACYDRIM